MSLTRRGWLNAALAVMAVALVMILEHSDKRPHRAAPRRLLAIHAGQITRITLARAHHRSMLIVRRGSHWVLKRPFAARADRFRVESLTDLVRAHVHDRFPAPAALGAFGLAPAQARLSVNGTRVLVGRRQPFGNLRYLLIGHMVALVAADTIHPRRLTVDSFLSTRLFGKRVRPIAFALPGLTVARQHGIWRARPLPQHTSNDRITTFVDEWRYARALSVDRYHGEPVQAHILIRYRVRGNHKGPVRSLTLGILERRPELALVRDDNGLVYHFPAETGERLLSLMRARTS